MVPTRSLWLTGFASGVFALIGLSLLHSRIDPAANAAPPVVAGDGGVAPAPSGHPGTPVLVELFTSEGCSSCPAADDLLKRLSQSQSIAGAQIIALEHHVDYWNDLGWPDPFSSPAATLRQRSYAHQRGGAYTPQAIIDGGAQVIGSRETPVENAIVAAAGRPHARIDLGVTASLPARGVFDVSMKVSNLPASTLDAEMLVAVVQDRARVTIDRGENRGRTVEHTAIARSMNSVGSVSLDAGALQTVVQLPAAVSAPDGSSFSVVAFIQERTSRRVLGTAAAPLPVTR